MEYKGCLFKDVTAGIHFFWMYPANGRCSYPHQQSHGMQGSADWRVQPEESLEMVNKVYAAKHPLRFILFEGADHGIREWRSERFAQAKRHFDYYLRDGQAWPSMEKHGK